MTLRDLLAHVHRAGSYGGGGRLMNRCYLILEPYEVEIPVSPSHMLKELTDHDFNKELDEPFQDDHMIYPWFEVWYDCAEGGTLYFHFKIRPNLADTKSTDVSEVLKGLC